MQQAILESPDKNHYCYVTLVYLLVWKSLEVWYFLWSKSLASICEKFLWLSQLIVIIYNSYLVCLTRKRIKTWKYKSNEPFEYKQRI